MHIHNLTNWQHPHDFSGNSESVQKRTKWVILITLAMMVAEIAGGYIFGSMALLADGWHMGTHAAALGITLFAYIYAKKHANDDSFSFGTGKVAVLGGYTSAVILVIVALLMIVESVQRFISPVPIQYNDALIVAIIGLAVNAVCAMLLQDHHHHGHDHSHHHCEHHDHNLKAAYFHVLADALTSFLAIFALLAGKYFGWDKLDSIMGIVGAVVILFWAKNLIKETALILLDGGVNQELTDKIKSILENDADNRVTDLHIWRISENHMSAIISVVTHYPKPPEYYKQLLINLKKLSHISIEVIQCQDKPCI